MFWVHITYADINGIKSKLFYCSMFLICLPSSDFFRLLHLCHTDTFLVLSKRQWNCSMLHLQPMAAPCLKLLALLWAYSTVAIVMHLSIFNRCINGTREISHTTTHEPNDVHVSRNVAIHAILSPWIYATGRDEISLWWLQNPTEPLRRTLESPLTAAGNKLQQNLS